MKIPSEFIQTVLGRTSIVDVIQSRLQLIKRGNHFVACCPFHSEKTPSFSVNPQKQFYYCFGCSAHGDVIEFLKNFDHLEFTEAVLYLAHQLGLELPASAGDNQAPLTPLFDLQEKVCALYQTQLSKNSAAVEYLKKRGVSAEMIAQYQIGYAPGGSTLVQNFRNQIAELTTLGLINPAQEQKNSRVSDGKVNQNTTHTPDQSPPTHNQNTTAQKNNYYDRFWERVMFPIRDYKGRVIGFGGRGMRAQVQPKYLNSSETPLFHKTHVLYGLYEARKNAHRLPQMIVVEGYLDVITVAQFGFPGVVATLGTAITPAHIQLLTRHTDQVVFCFDGDQAGRNAAWKALKLAMPWLHDQFQVSFLELPDDSDPDTFLHQFGADAFQLKLSNTKALPDYLFEHLQQEIPIRSLGDKAKFSEAAFEFIQPMPNGVYRQLMMDRLAQILGFSASQDLASLLQKPQNSSTAHATAPTPAQWNKQRNVRGPLIIRHVAQHALALLLQQPEVIFQVTPDLQSLDQHNFPDALLLTKFIRHLQQFPKQTLAQRLQGWESSAEKSKLIELSHISVTIPSEGIAAELNGALQQLQHADVRKTIQQLLQRAKQQGLTLVEKHHLQKLIAENK